MERIAEALCWSLAALLLVAGCTQKAEADPFRELTLMEKALVIANAASPKAKAACANYYYGVYDRGTAFKKAGIPKSHTFSQKAFKVCMDEAKLHLDAKEGYHVQFLPKKVQVMYANGFNTYNSDSYNWSVVATSGYLYEFSCVAAVDPSGSTPNYAEVDSTISDAGGNLVSEEHYGMEYGESLEEGCKTQAALYFVAYHGLARWMEID